MNDLHSSTCDVCGSTALPAMVMAGYNYPTCPKCSVKAALDEAAMAHLHALLWPAVSAWAQHWKAAGMQSDALVAILELEGLFWHPDGQMARPGKTEQAIEDALAEAEG